MDTISLQGISARGFHGVYPEERAEGQRFVVDVDLALPLETGTDDLSDTVNYAAIAELVVKVVTGEPRNLIETVAGAVADACLAHDPRIQSIRVTVHKPQAPVPQPFEDLSVTINRSRIVQRAI